MCVGEAAVHGAKRPHAREVLFDALSLLPMGGEKNLEGMGEAAIYRAKSLHQASQFHTVLAGTANIFHTSA